MRFQIWSATSRIPVADTVRPENPESLSWNILVRLAGGFRVVIRVRSEASSTATPLPVEFPAFVDVLRYCAT